MKACIKLAAKDLQYLVRVEEAARDMNVKAVVKGKLTTVRSPLGKCVCRTCGKVLPYKSAQQFGSENMQGGHVIPSRRASIVLIEENVHPQCAGCNKYRAGAGEDFVKFLVGVYGETVFNEIIRRKNQETKRFTDAELVEIRTAHKARIKRAEQTLINGETPPMAKKPKQKASKKKVAKSSPTRNGALAPQVVDLRPRQLEFDFDYESFGLEQHKPELELIAARVHDAYANEQLRSIEARLAFCADIAEAKSKFKKDEKGTTWGAWVTEVLMVPASTANEAIRIHKVLGKKDLDELAGLPFSSLYQLCKEGVTNKTRNDILKLAKDHYITDKQLKAMLGHSDGPKEETKSVTKDPESRDDVKAFVGKKVIKPLEKKLGSRFKELVPDVLREYADELSKA